MDIFFLKYQWSHKALIKDQKLKEDILQKKKKNKTKKIQNVTIIANFYI